jgi:hypothetical protein
MTFHTHRFRAVRGFSSRRLTTPGSVADLASYTQHDVKRPPPSRDPTRTGAIRRAFRSDIEGRLRRLKQALRGVLIKQDVLVPGGPAVATGPAFPEAYKLRDLSKWFTDIAEALIIDRNGYWIDQYIRAAYDLGTSRARKEMGFLGDANPYHVSSGEHGGEFTSGPGGGINSSPSKVDLEKWTKQLSELVVKEDDDKANDAIAFMQTAIERYQKASTFQQGNMRIAVHEVDGQIKAAGLAVINFKKSKEAEIADLGSIQSGSGGKVLDNLEKQLKASGVERINLTAHDTNQSFYEHHGYVAVGKVEIGLEVPMVKSIAEKLPPSGRKTDGELRALYRRKYGHSPPMGWERKDIAGALGLRDSTGSSGRADAIVALAQIELQGATDAMVHLAGREVASALLIKAPPRRIYQAIVGKIDAIGKVRLRALASTYIVRAFNEAKLDVYEASGIALVGTIAETRPPHGSHDHSLHDAPAKIRKRPPPKRRFKTKPGAAEQAKIERREAKLTKLGLVEVLTAGDDDVCDICEGISEAGPYTIDQARSLIPAHPNCRCAFIPADEADGEE